MDDADIPYLLDALASARAASPPRAAAQLAECLASRRGLRSRARTRRRCALAPAALAARGAGDATLAHAATLCAVLASRACAAAAPRSRAEIAAVAERSATRGARAAAVAEQAPPAPASSPPGPPSKPPPSTTARRRPSSRAASRSSRLRPYGRRRASWRSSPCARGAAREGGYYGARPVDDRGAARLAFGDAGGVEARGARDGRGPRGRGGACAGCPPNVARLRGGAAAARAPQFVASDAALRVVVDATHLHPPSDKTRGRRRRPLGINGRLHKAPSTRGSCADGAGQLPRGRFGERRRFECAPLAARSLAAQDDRFRG